MEHKERQVGPQDKIRGHTGVSFAKYKALWMWFFFTPIVKKRLIAIATYCP